MKRVVLAIAISSALATTTTQADQLDDIISQGTLRCGVTLDFPPMGSRDAENAPIGFDVDTCRDIATSLGVKAQIVETPFADRIPALVSGRVDIAVASTSDTLERAQAVGFSIPYAVGNIVVLTRKGTHIKAYADLKKHPVGGTSGSIEGPVLEASVKQWDAPNGSYRQYQNQADLFMALSQGKIDGALAANTVAYSLVKSGKFPELEVGDDWDYPRDYNAIVVKRKEYGMLNYLNLFINRQYRSGRYAELWQKWVGGPAPTLEEVGVYR